MKHAIRIAVAVCCFSLVALATAKAQIQYSQGPVERIVLVHILPGHFNAFMADLKANIVPLWDKEKAAGLIQGYQMFFNSTSSGPEDWDFGYSLTYANMAALDGLPDKVFDLRMKQYGDKTAEQKVIDKRVEDVRIVSSSLIRDITLR
jgi:hypothetical protein